MNQRGLTLLEVFIIVILIGVLAALFLPHTGGHHWPSRQVRCSNNLRQLYMLGTAYASKHKGEWPEAQGEDFWRSFTITKPPLIEPEHLEIFRCPLADDDWAPGKIDYRGPGRPWGKLGPGEPVGADKAGNHGDEEGGNVLLKDGSVQNAAFRDPLWKQCAEKLRP